MKDKCQLCGNPINRKNWPTSIYCLACKMKPKEMDTELAPPAIYRDAMKWREAEEAIDRLRHLTDMHGVPDHENMSSVLEHPGVWFTCTYCLGVVHSRCDDNPYTGHEEDCLYVKLKTLIGRKP